MLPLFTTPLTTSCPFLSCQAAQRATSELKALEEMKQLESYIKKMKVLRDTQKELESLQQLKLIRSSQVDKTTIQNIATPTPRELCILDYLWV